MAKKCELLRTFIMSVTSLAKENIHLNWFILLQSKMVFMLSQ